VNLIGNISQQSNDPGEGVHGEELEAWQKRMDEVIEKERQ